MPTEDYRKPLALALAGALALSAAFYTYQQYASAKQPKPETGSPVSLHRSNAVRRPRGRGSSENGYQPIPPIDYIEQACRHLRERNETGEGYGQYRNTWFFATPEDAQGLNLTLLPRNLDSIYQMLLQRVDAELTPEQQLGLRRHVVGRFLQQFFTDEFPGNYAFGNDYYRLERTMIEFGIVSNIVRVTGEAFDQGHMRFRAEHDPLRAYDPNIIPPRPSSFIDSRPLPPRIVERFASRLGPGLYPPLTDHLPTSHVTHTPHTGEATGSDHGLHPPQTDGAPESGQIAAREALNSLAVPDPADDDSASDFSIANANEEREEDPEGSQVVLDLLYQIASDQARRDAYVHRGVECNSCGVHPITGTRYHCLNCFDFDLCEACEALCPHNASHVFAKLRIPAPSRGGLKQVMEKWYPGNPDDIVTPLEPRVSKPLLDETGMERTDLDALYEQFKCIAGHYYPEDPSGLGIAIDRQCFDAYFLSSNDNKSSPANLIYDRIFAFYDVNQDGLIDFDEYIRGIARLQDKSRHAKLRRIFDGYDLDGDGYVDRRDFLRMFRAYHALSKELSREMFASQGDFGYTEMELQETIQASQPTSAAFGGGNLYGHESRAGQAKQSQPNGEYETTNGMNGVLQTDADPRGDRARAIGTAAVGDSLRSHPFRSFRREAPEDEPLMMLPPQGDWAASGIEENEVTDEDLAGPDAPLQTYPWPPPLPPIADDIVNALGNNVPLEDITDAVDRTRVLYAQSQRLDAAADQVEVARREVAVRERWRRRQFYRDEEEGMTKPPGMSDSSDDEDGEINKHVRNGVSPRRPSMASRSSSKVRFDDSAIDTDYETRSNTSSRSVPLGERWGGYELSQAEADIGKDILYQGIQQGLNQLLDAVFKEKEDEYMAAQETRNARHLDQKERKAFARTLELNPDLADPRQMLEINAMKRKHDKEEARHVANGDIEHLQNPITTVDDAAWISARYLQMDDDIADSPSSDDEEVDESYRDPTLPQFRPNAFEPESSNSAAAMEGQAGPSSVRAPSRKRSAQPPARPNPFGGVLDEARNLYYVWLRHDLTDAETNRRGGGGKLSFSEFRRKMVPEDEVAQALGERGKGKENEDAQKWESSSDLGRLAFVGTWLEMASF